MALRIPDYLRRAHKVSSKHGWDWQFSQGSKHLTVYNPQGQQVTTVSLTAYSGPLTRKIQSQLRRANCPGIG